MTLRIRPALLWHRWFGVIGGAWLFIIAFTGCLLVFYGELDRALNPELFRVPISAPAGPPRVAAAIRKAEAMWPGSQATYVRLPAHPGDSAMIYLSDRSDSPGAVGDKGREVYADPATSALLGTRIFGAWRFDRAHLMPFIYRLHYTLHAGETVRQLLGIVALVWLIDHFVALPLALRSAKHWTDAFLQRKRAAGHKRVFDLHRSWGMWLLPVTAALAVSGVYFNLNPQFMAALKWVAPPSPIDFESRVGSGRSLAIPPLDADAVMAAARSREAGLDASGLGYDAARGLWTIYARSPRDIISDNGAREISIDARTGAVIGDRHFGDGTVGDVIVAWQYPLHSGKAFGWPGRIVILLAGVATCTLVITGYLVWWRKRSARRRPRRPSSRAVGLAAE